MKKYHLIWNAHRHGVGIDSIDRQHKELIRQVNQIADAVSHGAHNDIVRPMMEGLVKFAETHFELEKRLMEETEFPARQGHIKEHQGLLKQMRNLCGDFIGSNRKRAELVSAFLIDWAELHIMEDDKALGKFLVEKGLS